MPIRTVGRLLEGRHSEVEMGGAESRNGFAFQDLVLATRVLAYVIARRAAVVDGRTIPPITFGLEAAPTGAAPDWDIIEQTTDRLVLEEAKSGRIDADDRWALWRRVRRTVAGLGASAIASVEVRLSVNAAELPPNPEHWRSLARQSQVVAGTWATPPPSGRKQRVQTAPDLANEAIHILSAVDADLTSPSLARDEARRVLLRFTFDEQHDANTIEQKVRDQLATLSHTVGVNELLNSLRGELAQRAELSDAAQRTFSADDLLRSFALLGKLAETDVEALQLWRTLTTVSDGSAQEAVWESGGLAYQDWTLVQPDAAATLKGDHRALAILGPGGLGKTVILNRWLAAQRRVGEVLALSGADLAGLLPNDLRHALELGAFAARHGGRKLAIGVDAIENDYDRVHRQSLLAALRAAASETVAVCVTSRALEWRSSTGTSNRVEGWHECELAEWPEEHVRTQVCESSRPSLSPDLIRLLRTPLLLDLFLRTFGTDAGPTAELQTRHGLLEEYWRRKVLPENDERSAERRALLLSLAEAEAAGRYLHSPLGNAARELTSEGLLSLKTGGRRVFRHALLRDFVMNIWARDAGSTAVLAQRLGSIESALVRFGAIRSALEADFAQSTPRTSLLKALSIPVAFEAATVLGEFPNLGAVSVEAVITASPMDRQRDFLRALLTSAKLANNPVWISSLARLPESTAWTEAAEWLTPETFADLVEGVHAMSEHVRELELAPRIAARLRSWSLVPRLSGEPGMLIRVVTHLDPSLATARWLPEVGIGGNWSRYWTLSELPRLVSALPATLDEADEGLLRSLYCAAAHLRDEGGRRREIATPHEGGWPRDQALATLVGQPGSEGILVRRPQTFTSIAAELLAGHEADESDQHASDTERINIGLASLPEPLIRDAGRTPTEEEARDLARDALTHEEAIGCFAKDAWISPYFELHDQEYRHLLETLRRLAEESLLSDGTFFDSTFWPSVHASRSVLLRALCLDILTREIPSPRPNLVVELLKDSRLYFFQCTPEFLQRGLRQQWATMGAADRATVLSNIRRSARRPAGNEYCPGPLLFAIPEADRPGDLSVFLQLSIEGGHQLDLAEDAREPRPFVPTPRTPTNDSWRPVPGISASGQTPWEVLATVAPTIPQSTDDEWALLIGAIEAIAAQHLPSPDALLQRTELIERIRTVAYLQQEEKKRMLKVSSSSFERIARWALDALPTMSREQITAGPQALERGDADLRPTGTLWVVLASLADTLLWIVESEELNTALFQSIDSVMQLPTPRLAWQVFTRVSGWFRCKRAAEPLLIELLASRVSDGNALSQGLRFLTHLNRAQQCAIMQRWLASETAMTSQRALVRDAGTHLGWMDALRDDSGQATGATDFIETIVAASTPAGVLSDVSLHTYFIGQATFGAKDAVRYGGVPAARANDYARRMNQYWRVLSPRLTEEHQADVPPFAAWAFHPFLSADNEVPPRVSLPVADRITFWRALGGVARAIVREGPSREVESLFRNLGGSPILGVADSADLVVLFETFHERLTSLTLPLDRVRWVDAAGRAAQVIGAMVWRTSDRETQERLYSYVAAWSHPPIASERAAVVARALRTEGLTT